jgi:two-component system, chemotaxis family, CheB/CheR fusion protein
MKKNISAPRAKADTVFSSHQLLQIVAIGASAGGLEAVTELLTNLTPDTGMAFIYVAHLSPDHKSLLTSLLAKATTMKVQEVSDKILMEPNSFYIIPPDKEMTVLDGHIQLTDRNRQRVVHLPIDTFFLSLAEIHRENTIGVILSGSGADGTRGLLAIKAAGGLTFAQNESAKFNSMPQSAIVAGAAEFVLSPKDIAKEIILVSKYDFEKNRVIKQSKYEIESNDPYLKTIFNLLMKQTLVDFSHYKMPTVKRRILRRMALNKISSLKEYAEHCMSQKDEINILYQDLLINVTTFFRDTDSHAYLKTTIFPKLLKSKKANEKLRIWIPACATGEEAYSIAMSLLEIQREQGASVVVQIFATDLSAIAITKARIGDYTKPDLKAISPKRLQQFYIKNGNTYRIAKIVRDMCVFAPHNILRDPPFTRVDFISCCNLFIYLEVAAQKKILNTFHYALNEEGYLMLGKSESIGLSAHLFISINKKFKIYARKKNAGINLLPDLRPRLPQTITEKKNQLALSTKNMAINDITFNADIDAVLLSKYVPASAVINYSMEIIQFRGETSAFLQHSSGKASLNILKMTAPEIALELRHCIPIAIKTMEPVRKSGIEIKSVSALKVVSIEVIPLMIDWEEPLLLVLFTKPELIETFLQMGKNGKNNMLAKDRKIQKLEEELIASRADLDAFAQDKEAFIEELQSANEEVVSSNEELQSVNEELETSKEEIESTVEELTTTNQELQTRNELLNESYLYSDAILANIQDPILVLDKDLRVVSASKSFYKKFTYTAEKTEGLLLHDLGNKEWDIPALRQLLEDILPKNIQFHDFEVIHTFPTLGERIMMLAAKRIYQQTHGQQLILLSIEDYTERKKAQQILKESEEKYQAAVSAVRGIVWTNNSKGEMEGEQKSWAELTGQAYEEYQGYGWANALHPDDAESTVAAWKDAVQKSANFIFEHRIKLHTGTWAVFSIKAVPIFNLGGTVREWVGVHTNITQQKIAEEKIKNFAVELEKQVQDRTKKLAIANEQLEENNLSLQILNKELQSFSYIASHDLQEPLRKIQTLVNRIVEGENSLTGKGKDYCDRILKSAQRMQVLIEDLLAFSSVHNTRGREFTKVDLNIIVEEVKIEFQEIIQAKNASIIVSDLCIVNIIPYQFRQVMINLIGNALKFTKTDVTPVIHVESKNIKYSKIENKDLPPLKEYCHIVITDNGIGFEPEYNEKIFDVFQRLHDKDEYPGTGIGLAIVKKIIENHRGLITAKSKLGEGSTFEIYIPTE